jgi:hypothetical protein
VSYRNGLARKAVTAAMRLRGRHGRAADQPICPMDLARDDGVDVRLVSIKSLDGMYTPDVPTIVLGSLRPRGRRAYTCAHELGHHVFGHGLRVDELLEEPSEAEFKDDTEYVADRFAAALLMPKLAVLHAFAVRHWDVATCDPARAFTIAGVLGVGYTTLVGYLEGTLRAISATAAHRLRKTSPKAIRSNILGNEAVEGLLIIDEFWSGRPVDAEVGDLLVVPPGTDISNDTVERARDHVYRATAPGVASLRRGSWQAELRVMRAGYTGLAEYRHLEEADDDE